MRRVVKFLRATWRCRDIVFARGVTRNNIGAMWAQTAPGFSMHHFDKTHGEPWTEDEVRSFMDALDLMDLVHKNA